MECKYPVSNFYKTQKTLSNFYLESKLATLKPNEILLVEKIISFFDDNNFSIVKLINSDDKISELEKFYNARKKAN